MAKAVDAMHQLAGVWLQRCEAVAVQLAVVAVSVVSGCRLCGDLWCASVLLWCSIGVADLLVAESRGWLL